MKLGLFIPARQESVGMVGKALSMAPPLNLAIVAALTPPGVDITLIDENVAAIDFEAEFDLIGITVVTHTALRAYEIADAFRARGTKVVLGGIHPTALPEEAGRHADAVVLGEAEGVWAGLVEDFRRNKLKKLYQGNEQPSLEGLPLPRRDLFAREKYFAVNTVSTTRGCPFSCSFCSVTSFFGKSYRSRPIKDVLKEIQVLDRSKPIFFLDDNIGADPMYARELFHALIPYKVKWMGQASVTVAKQEELLESAAASGCFGLYIGFESLVPASLASVGKKFNVVAEYEHAMKQIHSHRIAVAGSFVFGFDHDDESVFEHTVGFAQKVGLEYAHFGILTPFPGTALFEALDREGRIITKDWSQYRLDNVVFEPRLMSREALKGGHDWAWQEFYALPSILRRIGIARRYLIPIWAINLSCRRHWRGKVRIAHY